MFHVRAPHEIGYACARTALKSYNSAAPGGLCYVTVPSHFGLSSFPVPRITGSTIANRAREFWFGTKALWTILPEGGAWRGLPHYTPDDPTFRQKLLYWRKGYVVRTEPQPEVFRNRQAFGRPDAAPVGRPDDY
jgi:hypothetical protein